MWFFSRVSGIVVLGVVGALLLVLATDFHVEAIISIIGAPIFLLLLATVAFDLWEPPQK